MARCGDGKEPGPAAALFLLCLRRMDAKIQDIEALITVITRVLVRYPDGVELIEAGFAEVIESSLELAKIQKVFPIALARFVKLPTSSGCR